MHFLRRNRPGDCAARCKKTNDNLRNSKSFDLNGCDPQNLRLCPDAKQGGERGCSFDSFESWNWTKSKPFCRHNFPTNKVNPFYSFVLLKIYLFSSQTSWPTKYNISYYFNIIMILSSPRAESARAFTGRRNSHSERGEDFLSRQPIFFTETAVTPERKVEKWFPRWEINRHAEG